MARKFVSLALAAVLAVGMTPGAALASVGESAGSPGLAAASSGDIASGTLGTCTWVIDSEGCLTIVPANGASGSFEMDSPDYDSWPWYEYRDSIAGVVVESDVRASGSLSWMFYYCSSLTSVDLSGLDTSKVADMAQMFSYCESLTSLDLSSFDTSNVTDMSCMFEWCDSLVSLDVSGFDTSSVTSMEAMFNGCFSLASLDVSGFDTSNVTDMIWMFSNCSSITFLDLSNFDTSNVEYDNMDDDLAYGMCGMFDGCTALRKVALSEGFAFVGSGSHYLPVPYSSVYDMEGAWRSDSGAIYEDPSAIPGNTAATYTAVFYMDGEWATEPGFFADVADPGEWYYEAVHCLVDLGVVNGYTDDEGNLTGEFGPLDGLTRAQLVTMLWRYACPEEAAAYGDEVKAAAKGATSTADGEPLYGIGDGQFYTAAANWAVSEGVVTGFDNGDGTYDFDAEGAATFEQVATVLARMASGGASEGHSTAVLSGPAYTDGSAVASWAAPHVAWCLDEGLLSGYDNHDGTYTIKPGEDLYRARFARMLYNAIAAGAV